MYSHNYSRYKENVMRYFHEFQWARLSQTNKFLKSFNFVFFFSFFYETFQLRTPPLITELFAGPSCIIVTTMIHELFAGPSCITVTTMIHDGPAKSSVIRGGRNIQTW